MFNELSSSADLALDAREVLLALLWAPIFAVFASLIMRTRFTVRYAAVGLLLYASHVLLDAATFGRVVAAAREFVQAGLGVEGGA